MPCRWLVILCLLGSLSPVGLAAMEPVGLNPAEQVIASVSARVRDALRHANGVATDRRPAFDRIDEILLPRIDFERAARLVLGRYWRRATPDLRRRFVRAFRDLLVRTYSVSLDSLPAWRLEFARNRLESNARRTLVHTRLILARRNPLRVDYRMALGDAGWRVYDVVIEGVSLVTSYRASFTREARRDGLEALIERLEEKGLKSAPRRSLSQIQTLSLQ